MEDLDPQRLRIGFVVYGAMNSKDWRTVSAVDERQGMPEPKNNRNLDMMTVLFAMSGL